MGQGIQTGQGTAAGRHWLSLLIEAMEQAARTDLPACESPVPAALSLQLAQPAPTGPIGARPAPAQLTTST